MEPSTTDPAQGPIDKSLLNPEEQDWFTDKFWRTPKWLEEDEGISTKKDYHTYLKYNLRTRYFELEGDFRTAYDNFALSGDMDFGTARSVAKFLTVARNALEESKVDLLTVSSLLDLTERYIIWLFPKHHAIQRAKLRAKHLESSYPKYANALLASVKKAEESPSKPNLSALKSTFDEVVGEVNKHNKERHISFGLQIERLELLRKWGMICLLLAIFLLPILLNFEGLKLPKTLLSNEPFHTLNTFPYILSLSLILVISLIGALAGFMSGLLQVRNSLVNLVEFRESLLKFQLKPLIGGLTAVILIVLLSWEILPGIILQSFGSFILLAFLSGFSERYFLKLLNIDNENLPTYSPLEVEAVFEKKEPIYS